MDLIVDILMRISTASPAEVGDLPQQERPYIPPLVPKLKLATVQKLACCLHHAGKGNQSCSDGNMLKHFETHPMKGNPNYAVDMRKHGYEAVIGFHGGVTVWRTALPEIMIPI